MSIKKSHQQDNLNSENISQNQGEQDRESAAEGVSEGLDPQMATGTGTIVVTG